MNQDLSKGVTWSEVKYRDHLKTTLQDMFPMSAHEKDDEVKAVTARYLRYKTEYVKHLAFNSSEENFSKFI